MADIVSDLIWVQPICKLRLQVSAKVITWPVQCLSKSIQLTRYPLKFLGCLGLYLSTICPSYNITTLMLDLQS